MNSKTPSVGMVVGFQKAVQDAIKSGNKEEIKTVVKFFQRAQENNDTGVIQDMKDAIEGAGHNPEDYGF